MRSKMPLHPLALLSTLVHGGSFHGGSIWAGPSVAMPDSSLTYGPAMPDYYSNVSHSKVGRAMPG